MLQNPKSFPQVPHGKSLTVSVAQFSACVMKLRCFASHPSAARFSCLHSALVSSCGKSPPLYLLRYIRRRVVASLSSPRCLVQCERSMGGKGGGWGGSGFTENSFLLLLRAKTTKAPPPKKKPAVSKTNKELHEAQKLCKLGAAEKLGTS